MDIHKLADPAYTPEPEPKARGAASLVMLEEIKGQLRICEENLRNLAMQEAEQRGAIEALNHIRQRIENGMLPALDAR